MSSVCSSNKASDPVYKFIKKNHFIVFRVLGIIVGEKKLRGKVIPLQAWCGAEGG